MWSLPLCLYFLLFGSSSAQGPWVFYDEEIPEFHRVAGPRIQAGRWRRLTSGPLPADGGVILTFGTRAARALSSPADGRSQVVELFVAGRRPLVPGHEILPWEPPPAAVAEVVAPLRALAPNRPVCLLAGPRMREWAQEAAAVLPDAKAVDLPDTPQALAFVSRLHADPSSCAVIVLTADFEVLDFTVLQALIHLQHRRRIPLVARTRHEVLLGAAAAVEPYRDGWDWPASGETGARIFCGGPWRFWGLPDPRFSPRWGAVFMGN